MRKTFLEWLKTDKHIIKDFWLNPKSLAVSECNGKPFIVKCDSNTSDEYYCVKCQENIEWN